MKNNSTKRRGFIGTALVLMAGLFHMGANKKVLATSGGHASGVGWGGGAVYHPKRSKFKGFMRSESYKQKHKR